MKITASLSHSARSLVRRAGFTIVELWVSMAVGSICLGAVGVLYVLMAKEHRTGLADAVLAQKVDNLEDQLTKLFYTMSSTQTATLGSPNGTNANKYGVVVVSKGSGLPQEKIYYDSSLKAVMHDPNVGVAGDERTLWTSETNSVVLKDIYFTLGMKTGYKPDGTLLNITLVIDDDKASRRRSGSMYVANSLTRNFSVRLRGP